MSVNFKKQLQQKTEFVMYTVMKWISVRSPFWLLSILEHLLFILSYHVFRVCRKVVDTNLALAFPEKSEKERRKIRVANYRYTAKTLLQMFALEHLSKNNIEVEVRNEELLQHALQQEKGVLLVGAHLGNWELIHPILAQKKYPIVLFVGKQSNTLVDEDFNRIRGSFGGELVGRSKIASLALKKALTQQKIVAMLVDQGDYKSSLFVEFFGKKASMSRGTPSFYLRSRSPLLFTYCVAENGKYILDFQEIVIPPLSGNMDRDMILVSRAILTVIEEMIVKYPEQYFWMHKRWKHRPTDDPNPVYS